MTRRYTRVLLMVILFLPLIAQSGVAAKRKTPSVRAHTVNTRTAKDPKPTPVREMTRPTPQAETPVAADAGITNATNPRANKPYQWRLAEATGEKVLALRQRLDGIFSAKFLENATCGVYVYSASKQEMLYAFNERKLLMPASNMKVYTTTTALVRLGPNFTYDTPLIRTGQITPEGTLQGNLIIRGSGDPTITARFHNDNTLAVFQNWIAVMKQQGIKRVEGDVIGDDRIFDDQHIGPGWAWDYLEDWYAAQVSGLSLNDNCIDVYVAPGATVGAPAVLSTRPNTAFLKFDNRAVTVAAGQAASVSFDRNPASTVLAVYGKVALGSGSRMDWVTVGNPTLYAATVFCEQLRANGIEVVGEPYAIRNYPKKDGLDAVATIASYQSPPLIDIIRVINRNSQNLYAEQLLKTLGAQVKREGSFKKGADAVEEFLSTVGLEPTMRQIMDGSGLSRSNLVCAYGTVRLLDYMLCQPSFLLFRDTLPMAGRSGTLARRMRGTRADGNCTAKTGTIGNARALSGYVATRDGETLVFSMLVNNFTPYSSSMPLQALDNACIELASFSRN